MRLWAGMSPDFVAETTRNRIAGLLTESFTAYYRYEPPDAEVRSWQNSLRAMALLMADAKLDDHGVVLEYELPLSSRRLDCMIAGRDSGGRDNAVIVELKQWQECECSDADDLVRTWVGGGFRDVLHPSVQVGQYRRYLEDMHSAFHDGPDQISLDACAYLHNYRCTAGDPIRSPKFSAAIDAQPLFDMAQSEALGGFLVDRLEGGGGARLLERIEKSEFRPSRKLVDYVKETIAGQAPWVLIDEQLVVFRRVLAAIRLALETDRKHIVLVRGGPGTGKSVVAINLLGNLLQSGRHANYATASKAFTETLRHLLGLRARHLIRYFNSYMTSSANEVDVLICDEAHRLKRKGWNRFTPRERRREIPQVEELAHAARVSVFFIDDRQNVRADEVGSAALIRDTAARMGVGISEFELEVQFRCAGSQGFVNWIENTLDVRRTANILWAGTEKFDFRIVSTAHELERLIQQRVREGQSGRIAAGFCWPWSDPRPDGTLVEDVVFDDADGRRFRRPWNAKPSDGRSKKVRLVDAPEATLWATDPMGFGQVGCIYTAQGFEFDYAGVIWGGDLVYDLDAGRWSVVPDSSRDTGLKKGLRPGTEDGVAAFLQLVKNTYRVLLSRGMKGCYVYFVDKDTERFVRSRMELPREMRKVAEPSQPYRPT